jgi:CRISPR-associated endonuclease Cas1
MQVQSTEPHDGLVVAAGWGVRIYIERGHLMIHDGVGRDRRTLRLSRAYGGLKRLIVVGHTGFVTLEAMRWIKDVGAAFAQVGLDGDVVTVTSTDRLLDPKLRRAQALAADSPAGVELVGAMVATKVRRQAATLDGTVRGQLDGNAVDRAVEIIARSAEVISKADAMSAIRGREAVAGRWYWKTLAELPLVFESGFDRSVPDHWHRAGLRTSAGSGFKGPRKAATPFHAAVNYANAILEIEARLALQAYGFDPGLGIIHADKRYRGSLALDLMEPARPVADEVVLEALQVPLARGDVYETREGVCRVGPRLARRLASGAPAMREALMPEAANLSAMLTGTRRRGAPRRREPGTSGKGARLRGTPGAGPR